MKKKSRPRTWIRPEGSICTIGLQGGPILPQANLHPADDRTAATPPPFAVLFDWDGVVIDSSALHEESWERLAAELSLTLPEGHFKRGFGMKNDAIIRDFLRWSDDDAAIHAISLRKEALYREILAEKGIQALPGVRELLELLHAQGIPTAIGSSTHRLNITLTLQALGLSDRFTAICSAEDVTKGKPDPQVFLLAAEALHMPPEKCLVLEDAQVGIDAALAAGMKAVGVATTHPAEHLQKTHLTVHRLTELHWDNLLALARL